MKNRELIVPIYLKKGKVFRSFPLASDSSDVVADVDNSDEKFKCEKKIFETDIIEDAADFMASCENFGADALILFDLSDSDGEHEQSIALIKAISRATDLPLYGGGNIRRLEDVKKLIYAGCKKVFLNYSKETNVELTADASARFGQEKILACVNTRSELDAANAHSALLGGLVFLGSGLPDCAEMFGKMLLDRSISSKADSDVESKDASSCWGSIYYQAAHFDSGKVAAWLSEDLATGIFCQDFTENEYAFMEAKHALLSEGIAVNVFESSLNWEDIKTGSDGLLPVVVQDYRTLEVLMVAYMNEEAYNLTVRTGRMTYYSRSRQELWVKGLTSGHFQYVRELVIDCDNDTLLAKVVQIGAACHTGSRSCFYRPILKKEYNATNPLKVFEDVFAVIEDRKVHPKEGSYTNYLFDKGIDKILKKVGEEATEIVIAAKNPDPEEVVYEISDFLYHMMVLMAEKGLTWEDITEELAKR